MAAPLFTLKIGDGLGAHIGASEELFAEATVILTPNIPNGNMVLVDGNLRTVPAVPYTLDSDGKLNGNTGIQLLADDPSLGLDSGSHLQWHVSIRGAKQRGFHQTVKEWWIPAGTAGSTVELSEVPPTVGTTAVAQRGLPGAPTVWVEVDAGPPRLWQQQNAETGEFIGEPVDYLPDVSLEVAEAVNDQVPTAVTAEVTARDLVQRHDPGIPRTVSTTAADYLQMWLGPNGEFIRGDRLDGTSEISYARISLADITSAIIATGQTQAVDAAGLLWVPYLGPDGRTPEVCLTPSGEVPDWVLARWKDRGGFGGLGSSSPIDIVVVAGQSNATQRSSLPEVVEPSVADVLEWNGSAFVAGSGVPWLGSGFARRYQELHGRPEGRRVAVVKAGLGSAGFSTLTPGTWDRTVVTGADRYLYPEMIAKAQAALAAAPVGSRILCVLWSQGEADRSIAATTYADKLDDLISATRTALASPDLPFIISSLNPDWLTYLASVPDTRGATMDAVLEDTPRRVVRTSFIRGRAGLCEAAVEGNGIHWQPLGQKLRGIAMAEIGFDAALLNVATAEAQPPQNIRVTRSGDTATIEWDHPQNRVTEYTLTTSVNLGSSWVTETLSKPTTHKHVKTVSAGTPLWVRMSATNETGSSFLQEVHA